MTIDKIFLFIFIRNNKFYCIQRARLIRSDAEPKAEAALRIAAVGRCVAQRHEDNGGGAARVGTKGSRATFRSNVSLLYDVRLCRM